MLPFIRHEQPATHSALDGFKTESSVYFDEGWVELREYDYRTPTDDVWGMDNAYFLDLALSPRPGPARATLLGVDEAVAPERLGKLLVVPPGLTMRSGCQAGRQRNLHCALSKQFVEGFSPEPLEWNERALRSGLHLANAEIEWLLRKMSDELRRGGFGVQLKIEAYCQLVAIELIRCFQLSNPEDRRAIGGLSPWRLRLINQRLHADQPLPNLGELADLCGMSPRHLSRAFKVETGETVSELIETVMVEKARRLLGQPPSTVASVAQELGFSTPASFSYAYRRATGQRPSEVILDRRPH